MSKSPTSVKRDFVSNNDGTYSIVASQDLTAIIDRCKAMATHNDGYTPSRDMRRVAFIPDIIAVKWLNEEGWWYLDPNAKEQLNRKLNDPDWQHLRTAPGRV
jgi:hypothetical protein